ncbi:MAG: hypothetical protein ABSE47_12315, partial [Acidimicrobiales bacterium]
MKSGLIRRRMSMTGAMLLGAGLVSFSMASAGGSAAASGTPKSVTEYAVGRPICAPAKRGYSSCFAIRKVIVRRGTPGAVPFLVGDGTPLESSRAGAKATIGPGGGLTPTDLSSAYGFNPTASGRGQTVALVDAYNDPDINNELETFDTQYRLVVCNIKNSCLKVVGQTGTSSLPANDTTGWAVEESLDVEAVHSGVVITAAAGDDGYYSFDELAASGSVNAPDTPAAFPTVVAVGGTSLYLGQRGGRQSETVWNDNGVEDVFEEVLGQALGAGGGGCSARFTAPQWQHKVAGWSGTGCGTRRLVSDISAVADPLTGFDIFHSYNCGEKCLLLGWTTV